MEELLKPKEAGRLLKHSEQTLATWRCRGTGPRYLKVGGSIVYKASDLERFIEGLPNGRAPERKRSARRRK